MCATPWTVKRSIRPSSFFRLQAQNVCKTTNPGDRLSQSENGRRREKNSGEMCATGLKKKATTTKREWERKFNGSDWLHDFFFF